MRRDIDVKEILKTQMFQIKMVIIRMKRQFRKKGKNLNTRLLRIMTNAITFQGAGAFGAGIKIKARDHLSEYLAYLNKNTKMVHHFGHYCDNVVFIQRMVKLRQNKKHVLA